MRYSSITARICATFLFGFTTLLVGSNIAQARQCIEMIVIFQGALPGAKANVDVEWFKTEDVTFQVDHAARKVDVTASKAPFRTDAARDSNLFCNPNADSSAVALVRARDSGTVDKIKKVATAGSIATLSTVCPLCGIAAASVAPISQPVGNAGTSSDSVFEVRAEEDWIYIGIPSDAYVTTVLLVDSGIFGVEINVLKSKDATIPAAIAYSGCDFTGSEAHLQIGPVDDTSLKNLGVSNDSMSSISVSPGYSVNLFKDAHFQGQSKKVTGQQNCFDSQWNDQVSSVMVLPGG
ncbi:hypothetical protein AAFN47_23515 [Hoeflea sp. CAU 1731]